MALGPINGTFYRKVNSLLIQPTPIPYAPVYFVDRSSMGKGRISGSDMHLSHPPIFICLEGQAVYVHSFTKKILVSPKGSGEGRKPLGGTKIH